MLKKIALVIGILVLAVLALAETRPDTLHVERTMTIKARRNGSIRSSTISTSGARGHRTKHATPAMKKTYSGAPKDTGAVSSGRATARSARGG